MTEEQFSLMNAYFNDELSAEEDAAFIEMLSRDPALMQEFEMELMLRKGLDKNILLNELSAGAAPEAEPAAEHLEKIKRLLEKEKEKKPVISFYSRNKVALAAAAILLIAVLAWLYFARQNSNNNFANNNTTTDSLQIKNDSLLHNNNQKNPVAAKPGGEELYAENFTRYEKGIDDPPEADLVYTAYIEKKFDKVINTVKEDYQTMGADDSLATLYVNFYKALSCLEKNSLPNAEDYFNTVINSKEATDVLQDKAEWYLALALLKQNKTNAAKDILNIISKSRTSIYKARAKAISDVIDKTK